MSFWRRILRFLSYFNKQNRWGDSDVNSHLLTGFIEYRLRYLVDFISSSSMHSTVEKYGSRCRLRKTLFVKCFIALWLMSHDYIFHTTSGIHHVDTRQNQEWVVRIGEITSFTHWNCCGDSSCLPLCPLTTSNGLILPDNQVQEMKL